MNPTPPPADDAPAIEILTAARDKIAEQLEEFRAIDHIDGRIGNRRAIQLVELGYHLAARAVDLQSRLDTGFDKNTVTPRDAWMQGYAAAINRTNDPYGDDPVNPYPSVSPT